MNFLVTLAVYLESDNFFQGLVKRESSTQDHLFLQNQTNSVETIIMQRVAMNDV